MNTILIATDFSANARQAATYGYRFAQQLGAGILLCHAMNLAVEIPQTGMVAWPPDIYGDFTRDGNDELAKLRERLIVKGDPKAYQPEVVCLHDVGLVTDVLNLTAEVNHVSLIVTGVHGNDTLGTLMIGDHSRKMIDATVRPLLLVPPDAVIGPVKKIAFGCDFTNVEKDKKIIEELAGMAKTLQADLVLAHVDQHTDAPGYMLTAKHLVEELTSKLDYSKISFTVVSSKNIENGLSWLVRDGQIDMLAMVHREQGFFKHLLKGSFTQKTARQLTVPLLVFKSTK